MNNKDNIYGMRPISEKCNTYPYDKADTNYGCDSGHQERPISIRPLDNSCGSQPQNIPNIKQQNAECSCQFTNQPYSPSQTSCADKCPPATDACCCPDSSYFNHAKAQCICTYMNVLYSEGVANGPTNFVNLSVSVPNYKFTTEYSNVDPNCCNPCSVDSTSVFVVESSKATIKKFGLVSGTTILSSNVLVNGLPVLSVNPPENGGVSAVIDPESLNEECTCLGKGTKGNVLFNGISPWEYYVKYELCGKVTTCGNTCNFRIVAENTTIPAPIPDSLVFIQPEVCLPPKTSDPVLLNAQFFAGGQLVNPVITAVGGPCPAPVTLSIAGNLMLSTKADIQIMRNNKVCFMGTIE